MSDCQVIVSRAKDTETAHSGPIWRAKEYSINVKIFPTSATLFFRVWNRLDEDEGRGGGGGGQRGSVCGGYF